MKRLMEVVILIGVTCLSVVAQAYEGRVIDAHNQIPIAGAVVTLGDQAVRTDSEGVFRLEGSGKTYGCGPRDIKPGSWPLRNWATLTARSLWSLLR